jgi:hypothetical protein
MPGDTARDTAAIGGGGKLVEAARLVVTGDWAALSALTRAVPPLGSYLDAYFVLAETGRWPWEVGLDLPRRKFRQAVAILAPLFACARLQLACPLLADR